MVGTMVTLFARQVRGGTFGLFDDNRHGNTGGIDMNAYQSNRMPVTRLENIGFGSTVVAMAAAAAIVVARPAFTGVGTYLAEWKESCATMMTVAAQALGLYG